MVHLISFEFRLTQFFLYSIFYGQTVVCSEGTLRDAPLAQLVEQLTLNQWVRGSSPRRCTKPRNRLVSVINAVGPPVPIPNTEVKRCSGENTWLETAWENSSTLTQKNKDSIIIESESVIQTQWVHPFPYRTRKLSAVVAKILGWRRPGKIVHSRHLWKRKLNKFPFLAYFSLAQSVELVERIAREQSQ